MSNQRNAFDSSRGPMVNPHRPHGSCMRCLKAHTSFRDVMSRDYCDECSKLEAEERREAAADAGECICCGLPWRELGREQFGDGRTCSAECAELVD